MNSRGLVRTVRRRALEGFALILNSQMAREALIRRYVAEGTSAEQAAQRMASLRACARRRVISGCLALLALGALLNNAPRHSLGHRLAPVLIYAALFVLASQFSDKWFLRPGQISKRMWRR